MEEKERNRDGRKERTRKIDSENVTKKGSEKRRIMNNDQEN